MLKRPLGTTGIEVSLIGLGTVKFGRNQAVKYPKDFALPSDDEIDILLEQAKQLGINFLDTAPAYGKSEKRIGRWLKKTGERFNWIIATKFGENFSGGISTFDFSKKAAINSIHESLRRLQTDYLDLVLVHSNGNDVEIITQHAVLETLAEIKKSGKIRAFGMSTKTVTGGILAANTSDVIMVTYNPLERADKEVITHAQKIGAGILIKKALASGHIKKLSPAVNPVKESIHFILQEPGVSSVVIGTLNIHHLEEIVSYANLARPSP